MANQPGRNRFSWFPYWSNPAPGLSQPRPVQRAAPRASLSRPSQFKEPAAAAQVPRANPSTPPQVKEPIPAPEQAPSAASPSSQPHQVPITADQPPPSPARAIPSTPSQSQDPTSPAAKENAKSALKPPTAPDQPQRTTRGSRYSPSPTPSPSPSPSRKSAKSQPLTQMARAQPPSSPGRPAESPKRASTPKYSRSPSPSLSPSPSKDASTTQAAEAAAEELASAQSQYNQSASEITSPNEEPSEIHHPGSSQPASQLQDTRHEVEAMQNSTDEGSLPTEERTQTTATLIPHPLVSKNSHEKDQDTHESESSKKEEISTQLLEEKSENDAILKQSVPIKDIQQGEETRKGKSESASFSQPSDVPPVEEKVKLVKEDNLITELELIKEMTPLSQDSQTEIQSGKLDQLKVESNYPRQSDTLGKESNTSSRIKLSLAIAEPAEFEPNAVQPETDEPLSKATSPKKKQVKDQRMMTPNSSDASSGNHGKSSFQQEIREGINNLVQKLSIDQPNYLGRGKAVNIITLAGENKGASMYISRETSKKADGSTAKRKLLEQKSSSDQDPDENAAFAGTVNSNVQSINNSLVNESSCIEEDPGVHLTYAWKVNNPGKSNSGTELVEKKKRAVITAASAEKFTYEPNNIFMKRYHQMGSHHPRSSHIANNQKNDPNYGCNECPYSSNMMDQSNMEF